jgi:competence protein ComEA
MQSTSHLTLRELTGMRAADTRLQPENGGRHGSERQSGAATSAKPRLAFSSPAVCAAIFILILAVAASLTLLVIQSRNFEAVTQANAESSASAARVDESTGSSTSDSKDSSDSKDTNKSSEADAATSDTAKSSGTGDSSEEKIAPAQTQSAPQAQDTRIDINTADATQLDAVKGIGPATAQKIIDYRAQHGKFATVDALLGVQGIGAKTLEIMRPQLVAR